MYGQRRKWDFCVYELFQWWRSWVSAVWWQIICVSRESLHTCLSRPRLKRIHQFDLFGPLHSYLGYSQKDFILPFSCLLQFLVVLSERDRCGILLDPQRLDSSFSEAWLIPRLFFSMTLFHWGSPRFILVLDIARSLKWWESLWGHHLGRVVHSISVSVVI